MQAALVFPSATANRQSIINALKRSSAARVVIEGPLIVCKARDLQKLSGISGIDRVETARQVPRDFSSVIGAIVKLGSKTVMSGEKFYVKAIMADGADFVERDIEFASAGTLVEKLAKANALPARNEQEADRVILAVIGKRAAYLCVRGKT